MLISTPLRCPNGGQRQLAGRTAIVDVLREGYLAGLVRT